MRHNNKGLILGKSAINYIHYHFYNTFSISKIEVFAFTKQLALLEILRSFIKAGLVSYNNYSRYLFPYISRSLTTTNKLDILIHHYSFLRHTLSPQTRHELLTSGLSCYKEHSGDDELSVVLKSSVPFEYEGSLSLVLKINDVVLSILSFTFVPSDIFGVGNESAIYISRLQRMQKNKYDVVEEVLQFRGHFPAVILMKALEAIAANFKIKICLGITADNQLSLDDSRDRPKYYAIYDEFWLLNGGVSLGDSYLVPLPMYQKDILTIKQTHRNRSRKKRKSLSTFYDICDENISHYVL